MQSGQCTSLEEKASSKDKFCSAKIAQFIDTNVYGGAESIVVDLSHCLAELGFEVEILHFGNERLVEECNRRGLPTVVVPRHDLYKSVKTLPLFIPKFRRFLKSRKISLLHSHLFGSVTAAGMATAFSGIAHVGTLHDSFTITERPNMLHAVRLVGLLRTKLITVSKTMEEHFRSLASFNLLQLRTIHNGVDSLIGKGLTGGQREQLGFKPEEIVVTCVARLVPLKRHKILIDAFSMLSDLPVRLVLAGEGPEATELESLIKELSLADSVSMLGFRKDVSNILNASDIFALSSSTEGLSCSILESMACGLPTVACAVGGNVELIENGHTGLFTEATAEDFAAKIRILVKDPVLRRRMGENAKTRWRNGFARATMVKGYQNIYQELLATA